MSLGMKVSKLWLTTLGAIALCASASCNDDADSDVKAAGAGGGGAAGAGAGGSAGSPSGGSAAGKAGAATNAGNGGMSAGGSAGSGGSAPEQGGAASHEGGAPFAGAGGADPFPEECGDPNKDGVVVYQDITQDTTWSCPVYTLAQPIYVHGTGDEPTVLHIDAGVTVRGVKGNEPLKFPGALIVTRSGRLEAVGTERRPIRFTTALPAQDAAPGSWGGLMLLGRAAVNVPADFEASGKRAGEVYAEALLRTELGLYGWPSSGEGGAGGGPAAPDEDYESWSCGTLKYVRIEFAGFKAGSTKELNGLTLGGCGSGTVIEHVQVHRSSDDGVEIFGGSVNLKHIVLTGNQDDSLDWDQGWRGKAQFVAIQSHDDADTGDSCGIEADGYATPDAPVGLPSAPRIWNLTLILSKNTQRGIRFRDGTQAFVGNAILAADAQGVAKGLIDIDHVRTADHLAAGSLVVQHSIFRGSWPAAGQADTLGTVYLEQDFFTGNGPSATGNDVIVSASDLWLNAFNASAPEWVPGATSAAKDDAVAPSDTDGSTFFDTTASYRGAFKPGGGDWTAGWTSYP
jgi:hypothetical protein